MTFYTAYGLLIQSELSLEPLEPIETGAKPDIVICFAAVSTEGFTSARVKRGASQIQDNAVWLDVPGIARFLACDGNSIDIEVYPGADLDAVRLYLLGSAMGAMLHQRGYLVLHANAIVVDGVAVLFIGRSGIGKSTTAAVFKGLGYEVLSDDVVAIDQSCCVIGGFPQIKLWDDVLEALAIDKTGLSKLRAGLNKYSLPIAASAASAPVPVGAIYYLQEANALASGEFQLKPLHGLDKFNTLKNNTYRPHYVTGLGNRREHLQMISRLTQSLHMVSLTRSTRSFNAPELVDLVLQDLHSAGVSV